MPTPVVYIPGVSSFATPSWALTVPWGTFYGVSKAGGRRRPGLAATHATASPVLIVILRVSCRTSTQKNLQQVPELNIVLQPRRNSNNARQKSARSLHENDAYAIMQVCRKWVWKPWTERKVMKIWKTEKNKKQNKKSCEPTSSL